MSSTHWEVERWNSTDLLSILNNKVVCFRTKCEPKEDRSNCPLWEIRFSIYFFFATFYITFLLQRHSNQYLDFDIQTYLTESDIEFYSFTTVFDSWDRKKVWNSRSEKKIVCSQSNLSHLKKKTCICTSIKQTAKLNATNDWVHGKVDSNLSIDLLRVNFSI